MLQSVTQTLEIPVRNECDSLVVGAGPAGIGAALTAARKGARVTLVEYGGKLGGMWTLGLLSPFFDNRDKPGLNQELREKLAERHAWGGLWDMAFDPSQMALLLNQMALEAKLDVLLYTTACEPYMQGDTILRMTVDHLPGDDISLIRLFKQNGQPKALYISAHQEYKNKKWHIVADERKEKTISLNQWHEAMHLAASIDTLPWVDKGQTIDGNRYQFEYRHADSFHSHYSCFDRTGLGGFLFRLFYKDYKDFDE